MMINFLNLLSVFENMEIVVSVKMDGENTSLYNDHFHARSIDSKMHSSRNWIKSFWSAIKTDIPDNYRICGENLYAKHSIKYNDLKSYFYGFSVWHNEICLSWTDTLEFFNIIGIQSVEVIYEGVFDENILRNIANTIDLSKNEGYVVRNKNQFIYSDFSKNVGKFVRKGHVQTDDHWMYKKIEPNEIVY